VQTRNGGTWFRRARLGKKCRPASGDSIGFLGVGGMGWERAGPTREGFLTCWPCPRENLGSLGPSWGGSYGGRCPLLEANRPHRIGHPQHDNSAEAGSHGLYQQQVAFPSHATDRIVRSHELSICSR